MTESSFTTEQETIALEVLGKDKHAFYEVLRVNRSADDQEIKKSYRKLAIKLHPDKNPHPKASEAFKVINRAFEVLSDSEKRQLYDRLGRDPDDRSMSSGSSTSYQEAGFPQEAFFNRRHAADPREDIFDFLFNMGGSSPFGGPFGNHPFGGSPFMNGGGATSFSFGGPGGFRVYTNTPRNAHQRQRQRQQHQQQQRQETNREQDIYQSIRVLLPLLVLFLVPLLERFLFG